MRNSSVPRAVQLLALLGLSAFFSPLAHAAGVLICDNCTDSRALALTSGTGPTIVADFSQRKLHGYEVEYDRELHRYRAVRIPVPDPIVASFNRIMGMLDRRGIRPRQRGVQFEIHPDDPGAANGIVFPDEFKGHNAHDIAQMATARFRLESQIGEAFTGATTNSTIWNSMATFLSSIGLSFVSKALGIDGATYVITWRDGSKTTLLVRADSVNEAKYVQGGSKDAQGNRIPDGAASNPDTAQGFAGVYQFNDKEAMQRWIDTARLYGVTVIEGSGIAGQLDCRWDGQTLTCGGG